MKNRIIETIEALFYLAGIAMNILIQVLVAFLLGKREGDD
jgi:Na+-driven multidrug efflux pump